MSSKTSDEPFGAAGDVISRAVGQACTAAVLLVSVGARSWCSAYGLLDPAGTQPERVLPDSPFDLASLTKLFTASAVLRLVANGEFALDDQVARWFPEFSGPVRSRVTVRRLLTHSSGLPAELRLYGPAALPGEPARAILECPLVAEPGSRVTYSDVGFMVLGLLVEVSTGSTLPSAVRDLVTLPLQLSSTGYGPCRSAPSTEFDPWRGRRLSGEVHDENAFVLGGAAGHAGLFGSAGDVLRLARAYMHDRQSFLPSGLRREATSELAVWGDERRGLGWKLRSPDPDASEAAFSNSTFGHYGYTGTAVWSDPDRDLTVVLLTNRVYFGRDPQRIRELRRSVFTSIVEGLMQVNGEC